MPRIQIQYHLNEPREDSAVPDAAVANYLGGEIGVWFLNKALDGPYPGSAIGRGGQVTETRVRRGRRHTEQRHFVEICGVKRARLPNRLAQHIFIRNI